MKDYSRVGFLPVLILLVSLVLGACSQQPEPEPETVISEHFAALGSRDIEKAMSYVAEDAVLWLAGNCLPRDAFQEANEAEGPEIEFEPTDFRVNGTEVFFTMKVLIDGQVVDPGSDAVAYVEDGKIQSTGDCAARSVKP